MDWWMVHCRVEQGKEKEDGEPSLHDVIKELFRQKKNIFLRRTSLTFTSNNFVIKLRGFRFRMQEKRKGGGVSVLTFNLYYKKYVVSFLCSLFKMRRLRRIV